MNEFDLIQTFFKNLTVPRDDVVLGIGDDAAILDVPADQQLLVSTDTLVADVHFHSWWDGFDVAYKGVMVNVSDLAAMAATPCWLSLSLTLPSMNQRWLERFAAGLKAAMNPHHLSLVGGDTTRGPLSMTYTIHGMVPRGKAVRRSGARPGDKIYVSGPLGGAACALAGMTSKNFSNVSSKVQDDLTYRLKAPCPRTDLIPLLRSFATAAIDLSDGLSGDVSHLCDASHVGALIDLAAIPYCSDFKFEAEALHFALNGGDDYELCFTLAPSTEDAFLEAMHQLGTRCYCIGTIEQELGLRARSKNGTIVDLTRQSYQHF